MASFVVFQTSSKGWYWIWNLIWREPIKFHESIVFNYLIVV